MGHPGTGGVDGDAKDVDAAGGVLDDEQHIEPVKQQGVDVEEVGGQDAVGLGGKELSPGGPAAARCGIDTGSLEDQPHGAGRKVVAEPGEFAVNPSVSPGRVLRSQAQHQPAQLRCRGPAAGAAPWGLGPAPCHQVPVPAHDRGRGHDSMQSASLGQ
ncbi:MAG: hypothetical protein ACRDRN_03225 [Sciscionella sp.]